MNNPGDGTKRQINSLNSQQEFSQRMACGELKFTASQELLFVIFYFGGLRSLVKMRTHKPASDIAPENAR